MKYKSFTRKIINEVFKKNEKLMVTISQNTIQHLEMKKKK